jgi:hypothetical protein
MLIFYNSENLVSNIKGGAETSYIWEQGVEEDIWKQREPSTWWYNWATPFLEEKIRGPGPPD